MNIRQQLVNIHEEARLMGRWMWENSERLQREARGLKNPLDVLDARLQGRKSGEFLNDKLLALSIKLRYSQDWVAGVGFGLTVAGFLNRYSFRDTDCCPGCGAIVKVHPEDEHANCEACGIGWNRGAF